MRLASLLFFISCCFAEDQIYQSAFADSASLDMVKATFKSILIIVFLLVFLFVWYRKILPNIQTAQQTGNIRLVEKLHLDPTTVVYLLEVGNMMHLMATSNKTLQTMASYSKKDFKLKAQSAKVANKEVFADYLKELQGNALWLKIKKWRKRNV